MRVEPILQPRQNSCQICDVLSKGDHPISPEQGVSPTCSCACAAYTIQLRPGLDRAWQPQPAVSDWPARTRNSDANNRHGSALLVYLLDLFLWINNVKFTRRLARFIKKSLKKWGFVHFSRGTNSTNSTNSINSTTPMESSLGNQTLHFNGLLWTVSFLRQVSSFIRL